MRLPRPAKHAGQSSKNKTRIGTHPGRQENQPTPERVHLKGENMKNSREQLQESAAGIQALEAIISANRTALATAQQQAETAQETLKAFDGLNAKIAQWRAGEIRAKRTPGRLPQALRDRQETRQNAQEELSLSLETSQLIAADLLEDEKKLARLKATTLPAAAEVVHQEVIAPLAQQLTEINKRQFELESLLRAWLNLRVVGEQGWVSLGGQQDVAAALQPYMGQQFIVSADPAGLQASRFKSLVDELVANPTAAIQPPALVQPKDFY
jgi:hypothetical protein